MLQSSNLPRFFRQVPAKGKKVQRIKIRCIRTVWLGHLVGVIVGSYCLSRRGIPDRVNLFQRSLITKSKAFPEACSTSKHLTYQIVYRKYKKKKCTAVSTLPFIVMEKINEMLTILQSMKCISRRRTVIFNVERFFHLTRRINTKRQTKICLNSPGSLAVSISTKKKLFEISREILWYWVAGSVYVSVLTDATVTPAWTSASLLL